MSTRRPAQFSWSQGRERLQAPAFEIFRSLLAGLPAESWPDLATLNRLARERSLTNARSVPIRFAANSEPMVTRYELPHYELRVAESGEVATRENWHDLLNALQWLSFPQAKAALNEQHTAHLLTGGREEQRARSVARDVLTLFDEGGVIVASTDAGLLDLLREFRWRELFVQRRAEVQNNMRFFPVGHGLLEKLLAPFIGITAKAMLLEVEPEVLNLPQARQVAALDLRAAQWLRDSRQLQATRNLHPLPVLGIPGWDARSESPAFYEDSQYFRSGYAADRRSLPVRA